MTASIAITGRGSNAETLQGHKQSGSINRNGWPSFPFKAILKASYSETEQDYSSVYKCLSKKDSDRY
jgi:hypothetical protein